MDVYFNTGTPLNPVGRLLYFPSSRGSLEGLPIFIYTRTEDLSPAC